MANFNSDSTDFQYFPTEVPRSCYFKPYKNNGGTVMAIAGDDFVVIGGDTRLSSKFKILTKNETKLFPLSNKCILGCSGFWGDIITLTNVVQAKIQLYEYENNSTMSTEAISQMISTIMYYKRFFPYYTLAILAGLDKNNKGCVFRYDPIGHCERTSHETIGTAAIHLIPFLDNQIKYNNMQKEGKKLLTQKRAISILKDAFISAAERDILTGGCVELNMITKKKITFHMFDL